MNELKKCPVCEKQLEENANFCHSCGESLTELAKDYEYQRSKNAKLEILNEIIDLVEDKKTLTKLKLLADKLIK